MNSEIKKTIMKFFDEGNFSFVYFLGRESEDPTIKDLTSKSLALMGNYEKALKIIEDPEFKKLIINWTDKESDWNKRKIKVAIISRKHGFADWGCQFNPISYFDDIYLNYEIMSISLAPNKDADLIIKEWSFSEIQKAFEKYNFEPELIIFHEPEYFPHIDGIEKSPYPYVAISVDFDYFLSSSLEKLKAFDTIVVMGGISHMILKKWGLNNVITMPGWQGYLPEMFRFAESKQKDIDLFFSGLFLSYTPDSVRTETIKKTIELDKKYNIVIREYEGVDNSQYVDELMRAKVIFSNHRRGEMQARITESLAAGVFVLVAKAPEIKINDIRITPNEAEIFYEKGVDFFQPHEITEKFKKIIENWDEYRKEVEETQKWVLKNMSAQQNFKKFLDTLIYLKNIGKIKRQNQKVVIDLALAYLSSTPLYDGEKLEERIRRETDENASPMSICSEAISFIKMSVNYGKKGLFYTGIKRLFEGISKFPNDLSLNFCLGVYIAMEKTITGERKIPIKQAELYIKKAESILNEINLDNPINIILPPVLIGILNIPNIHVKYHTILSSPNISEKERENKLKVILRVILYLSLLKAKLEELNERSSQENKAEESEKIKEIMDIMEKLVEEDSKIPPPSNEIYSTILQAITIQENGKDKYLETTIKIVLDAYRKSHIPSKEIITKMIELSEYTEIEACREIEKELEKISRICERLSFDEGYKFLHDIIKKKLEKKGKNEHKYIEKRSDKDIFISGYVKTKISPHIISQGDFDFIVGVVNFLPAKFIIGGRMKISRENPVVWKVEINEFNVDIPLNMDFVLNFPHHPISLDILKSVLLYLELIASRVLLAKGKENEIKSIIWKIQEFIQIISLKKEEFIKAIKRISINLDHSKKNEASKFVELIHKIAYMRSILQNNEILNEILLDLFEDREIVEKLMKAYAILGYSTDELPPEIKNPTVLGRIKYQFISEPNLQSYYDRVKIGKLFARFLRPKNVLEVGRRIFEDGLKYINCQYEFAGSIPQEGTWHTTIFHSEKKDEQNIQKLSKITEKYMVIFSPEEFSAPQEYFKISEIEKQLVNYFTYAKYSSNIHIFEKM